VDATGEDATGEDAMREDMAGADRKTEDATDEAVTGVDAIGDMVGSGEELTGHAVGAEGRTGSKSSPHDRQKRSAPTRDVPHSGHRSLGASAGPSCRWSSRCRMTHQSRVFSSTRSGTTTIDSPVVPSRTV
jgi:hypothetical protein